MINDYSIRMTQYYQYTFICYVHAKQLQTFKDVNFFCSQIVIHKIFILKFHWHLLIGERTHVKWIAA